MPGGDRTGPRGAGPMSGRGAGFCRGGRNAGFTSAWGQGSGVGRGWRNWFFATGLPGWTRGGRGAWFREGTPDTRTDLEDRARILERELEATRQRLNDLSQAPKP